MSRLYVGNIPFNASEEDLRLYFSDAGILVTRVKIILDRDTQRPKGFAFVDTEADPQAIIATLNGQDFGGRTIVVNLAIDKSAAPKAPVSAPKVASAPAPAPAAKKDEFESAWKQPSLADARRR